MENTTNRKTKPDSLTESKSTLTSFLHEAEQLIQEFFPLHIVAELVQLQRYETHLSPHLHITHLHLAPAVITKQSNNYSPLPLPIQQLGLFMYPFL